MKTFKVKHAYSDLVCYAFETEDATELTETGNSYESNLGQFPTGSKFILDPKTEGVLVFLVAYAPSSDAEFKTNWIILPDEATETSHPE